MNMLVSSTAVAAMPKVATANSLAETPIASGADPIFAMIEKHRKANAEFYEALAPMPDTGDPDPEKEDVYGTREDEARWDLATTAPTTLAGLLALLVYVNGMSTGESTPNGKRDECFAEDDLANMIAGAEECLQAHFGGSVA